MDPIIERLSAIQTTLTAKRRALQYAEQVCRQHARIGDAGWLLSPAAAVPGTLLAVIGGRQARQWAGHVARLQNEISALTLEAQILTRLSRTG